MKSCLRDGHIRAKQHGVISIHSSKVLSFLLILAIGLWAVPGTQAMGPEGYFRQGTIFLQKGQLDLAIWAFTRAINGDPSYVEAYNNRALAYYEKGKISQAEADFLKALDLEPDNEMANANLGILYFERGSYEKAIHRMEKAVENKQEFSPYDAVIFRNLAFVYKKMGLKDRAESSIRTATSIETSCPASAVSILQCQYPKRTIKTSGTDHVLVLKIWPQR